MVIIAIGIMSTKGCYAGSFSGSEFEYVDTDEVCRARIARSGNAILGVSRLPERGADLSLVPRATIPAVYAGHRFCFQTFSIDGLYERRVDFRMSKTWQGGRLILPFDPQSSECFSATPDNLALLLAEGGCDVVASKNSASSLFPVAWNEEAISTETLVVYYNSSGSIDVNIGKIGADSRTECSGVVEINAGAFSHLCKIVLSEHKTHGEESYTIRDAKFNAAVRQFKIILEGVSE